MGTWSLALRLLTLGSARRRLRARGSASEAAPPRPPPMPPCSPGGERGSSAVEAGTLRCLRVPDDGGGAAGAGAAGAGWTQTPAAREDQRGRRRERPRVCARLWPCAAGRTGATPTEVEAPVGLCGPRCRTSRGGTWHRAAADRPGRSRLSGPCRVSGVIPGQGPTAGDRVPVMSLQSQRHPRAGLSALGAPFWLKWVLLAGCVLPGSSGLPRVGGRNLGP